MKIEIKVVQVCQPHQLAILSSPSRGRRLQVFLGFPSALIFDEGNIVIDGELKKILPDLDGEDWNKFKSQALKVVGKFRSKLTAEENSQWSNEEIIRTFRQFGDAPDYVDGATAKQTLLNMSAKELAKQPSSFESVGRAAKLHGLSLEYATKFWDVVCNSVNLGMDRGKYLLNAAKGKGLLHTGGYDNEQLEKVGGYENENGIKQRGDLVPGPGGSEVWRGEAHGGHGNEPAQVILSLGHGPDNDGDPDDEEVEDAAKRLRNKWRNDRINDTAAD